MWLNDVIKPSFPRLRDSCQLAFKNWWTQAHLYVSRINGLKTLMLWKSMASSKLCSASLWIHVIYAIEKRLTNEIMHWQIDGLNEILPLKSMDSWIYALEIWLTNANYALANRWTQWNFALEIDGLMNIMFFGHLWLFYSVNTWDLKCKNMTSVGQLWWPFN